MNIKTTYLPGLNGLRAIAALSVVFSHITLELQNFNLNSFLFGVTENGTPKGLDLANYGVTIFFALSGFLITFLLLKEKQIQEISVKKFYIRRILRIWPLYYLFLIIVLIITISSGMDINLKSLILYLFYLANVPFIFGFSIPLLAHYWSLGVEEQFYLFWPWFIKKINNKLILTISAIVILIIGVKLTLHFSCPGSIAERIIHISRFHRMLVGALGAVMYFQKSSFFIKITDHKITQALSLSAVLLLLINKFHVASVLDNEIVAVITVCLIVGQINVSNRLLNFDNKVFDFLGKISYGIYVIHPLVIYFLHKSIFPHFNLQGLAKYLIVYTLAFSLTIFISYLSYQYFEKYFLNLKAKFSIVKSSGAKYF